MFEVQSLVHLEPICQIEFHDLLGNLLLEGAKRKKKKKPSKYTPLKINTCPPFTLVN